MPLLRESHDSRSTRDTLVRDVLITCPLQLDISPSEIKVQSGGENNAHCGEGHIGDIGLPVLRTLRTGVEVRGVDRGQV